ncbi:hypothetical protein E2C01_092191 [Portunus trituberculatus]|uniref:Uncharacterized protein n=1 Tax=Portunus trituberculatus TaxID=210409 RepID=A0A5B7JJG5_PORTR|nr:hypothetical protein [Portunus trituberculatus]
MMSLRRKFLRVWGVKDTNPRLVLCTSAFFTSFGASEDEDEEEEEEEERQRVVKEGGEHTLK